MANFKRRKHVFLTVDEFNDKLEYAKKNTILEICDDVDREPPCMFSFVSDGMVKTTLTMRDPQMVTYVTRKDGQKMPQVITGLDAFIELSKDFKRETGYNIPRFPKEEIDKIGSATPLLGFKNTKNERVQAWSYDQNSSYAWAACQPMPDTRKCVGQWVEVQEGQVGFTLEAERRVPGWTIAGGLSLEIVKPGMIAEWVFDTMPSPFAKFMNRWYDRKKNAKNPDDKAKAKQMIVYAVGYLQKVNPFLRAAIVGYANDLILSLLDKNSIYCNTDCIVSTVKRDDLAIGLELGEFKVEDSGMFGRSGFNYQWDLDLPTYRGIPKSWFKDGWDIMKDPVPQDRNLYYLNTVKMKLEENDNGKIYG